MGSPRRYELTNFEWSIIEPLLANRIADADSRPRTITEAQNDPHIAPRLANGVALALPR